MDNRDIAAKLDQWADILLAQGAGRYAIRAYRRAADTVAGWPHDVAHVGDVRSLPGIGDSIAKRIRSLLEGGWPELDEAAQRLGLAGDDVPRLRGDLHTHTTATDGRASIQDMALAAQARGYEYLAITDHSQATAIAGGLDKRRMQQHLDDIRRTAQDVKIALLAGAEVDILKDGSLDLPDTLLADMDVVVCSVHFRHNLDGAQQTERILKAMNNDHADILAHPTARRGKRPPMDIDIGRLAQAAADQGWSIEINGSPDRLDLRAAQAAIANRYGVFFALDSDAHATGELGNVRNALVQARMAGVSEDHMLNAMSLAGLVDHLA